jgi:hypothetical protein
MSQKLINLNSDLKRLRDEGYEIEVRNGYALVHNVPYVNKDCQINYGILISNLELTGDLTINPLSDHVIHFCGEHPCDIHGSIIEGIKHSTGNQPLFEEIVSNHTFSNRPSTGYANYYDKFIQYIKILMAPALSLDNSVTAQTYKPILSDESSVFQYLDTNSSRSSITSIAARLEGQKVSIIGLGGTGSYILDFLAKTPVAEIHLFDGDEFLQHNAFRAPGAPSLEVLKERRNKSEYFGTIYSNMHKGIRTHNTYLNKENVKSILFSDFVFICIDEGSIKREIINTLLRHGKPFVDSGIGVDVEDNSLLGLIRVTTGNKNKSDHIYERVSFSDGIDDVYSTNIQIAELNAINASLAIIQWKKLYGFYTSHSLDFNNTYSTYTGDLINEDRYEKS